MRYEIKRIITNSSMKDAALIFITMLACYIEF